MFGAHAVNAYVDVPRMTQDVDILSPDAASLAAELRDYLAERFGVALRIRTVAGGRGYRVSQVRRQGNRNLAHIRAVEQMPHTKRVSGVLVPAPADLIAMKLVAYAERSETPKSGTDWRDRAELLLAFPELKNEKGPVAERLTAMGCGKRVLDAWKTVVKTAVRPNNDEDGF